jgi:RNA polymerase primary sigma factor
MGDESSIMRHLRAGRDQRERLVAAVAAFRRLSPEDYGPFLAAIESVLGGDPTMIIDRSPRLLPQAAEPPKALTSKTSANAPSTGGSLRERVLELLSDGQSRTTTEIRRALETVRAVNPASLHSEIFTMRKAGLLRSEGRGRGTRHTRGSVTPRASRTATAASKPVSSGKTVKRKSSDDDDRPASRASKLDAEQLYSSAIRGHHLLTRAEELALARRLEETEISLWKRLLGGQLAEEARSALLTLEPPVKATSPRRARAADLDRLVAIQILTTKRDSVDKALATEIRELETLAREADRIRERFASCNLRLVPSVIRRYGYQRGTNLSMPDLIQEGNLGLLRAIPRFDYRRGLRFSTFATWWIRHYLVRARQNFGAEVRVPVHLHDLAIKAHRAKLKFHREFDRDPDHTELARALKISEKSVRTLESAWLKHRESLPAFDSVGEDGTLPSYLASDGPMVDEVMVRLQEDDRLATAVAGMPALLGRIILRRFGLDGGEPETLREIGKSMNLSRERIRQLEQKALRILRQALDENVELAA